MKHKKLKLSAVFLLGLGLTSLQAQETITASGGKATGTGGTQHYSVGQVFYKTNNGINGTVSQGVQQPYEISVVTEINEAKNISLQCSVYPNPTTEFVKLKVDASTSLGNLNYQIYDINGKLLQSQKIESNETNLTLKNYVPAIYFIKIMNNNKEIKTFKIIKN
jgi:hypothetical protein